MEVAGIVIGGVGLVALFDNCMNAFQCIDSGRKYGRDYQEAALKVSLIQLRLVRWRKTVEIVEDSSGIRRPHNIAFASDDEVEIVRDLLESIHTRFKEVEKASTRHGLKSSPQATQPAVPSIDALTTRVETLALARQKTSSFGQKAQWALHDKRKIGSLITALSELTSDLVELFPAVKEQQLALARQEAQQLMLPAGAEGEDETLLAASLLDKASEEVDPQLKKALKKMGRHSFGDAAIEGSVKLQQGDYVDKCYQGQKLEGGGHQYGNMTASGDSKVQQGDSYGGKSFWE